MTNLPLSGNTNKSAAQVKGHTPRLGEPPRGIYSYGVAGDFFAGLGLSLVEGRFLATADSRRPERVCVVDRDFARRYWPEGGAIGQRIFHGGQAGPDEEAFTVVGVVGAVKQADLTDDSGQGAVYYPYGYWPGDNNLFMVARTSLPPDSLGRSLHDVVRQVDPELVVSDLRSMETRLTESLVARRSPALLAGLFSGVALLLAAVGTYGVLSYAVAQRRREIGLRMALGAQPGEVRGQFVTLALRLLATSLALGVLGAGIARRALEAVLFQAPALPVAILAATAGVLTVVSLAACVLPARRAARMSPMEALAEE